MQTDTLLRIGIAGWSVPPQHKARFAGEGTHLTRYARRFNAVEINSSFYRPHRPSTYRKWAESVPDAFSFSLKLPKTITHERRPHGAGPELDRFLGESDALGSKRRCILIQLPPSLEVSSEVASDFFRRWRDLFDGMTVVEARHPGWFTAEAGLILDQYHIYRVL